MASAGWPGTGCSPIRQARPGRGTKPVAEASAFHSPSPGRFAPALSRQGRGQTHGTFLTCPLPWRERAPAAGGWVRGRPTKTHPRLSLVSPKHPAWTIFAKSPSRSPEAVLFEVWPSRPPCETNSPSGGPCRRQSCVRHCRKTGQRWSRPCLKPLPTHEQNTEGARRE
jgi:hypothetical protein